YEHRQATSDPADSVAAGKRLEKVTAPSPSRKQRRPRKISPLVGLLVLSGVGGSLLIVASSVFICLWLWNNPPDTWWSSKRPDPPIPAQGGRTFAQARDVRGHKIGDDDGKEAAPGGAEEQPQRAPPAPPRQLEFASLPPKEAAPPPPAPASANPQLP